MMVLYIWKKFYIILFFLLYINIISAMNVSDSSLTYFTKAEIFMENAVYDSAIYYYQKSILITSPKDNYIKTLINIANIYRIEKRFDSAEFYVGHIEKYLDVLKENKNKLYYEYLHLKGTIQGDKGNFSQAISLLFNAIKMNEENIEGHDTLVAKSYNNLGVYHYYIGDLKSALRNFEKALELVLLKKDTQTSEISAYYQNIGILYAKYGDFEKTLDYFNKNLEINKAILADNDPELANIYLNLGNIYQILSQYDKALEYSGLAEKIFKEKFGNDYASLGLLYSNTGLLHYQKSNLDEAELFYKNALRIYQINYAHDHPDIGRVYNNLGLLYFSNEQYEKALEFYEKGLSIVQDPNSIIINLRNIADAYNALKKNDIADMFFKKSIQKALDLFGESHYELGYANMQYGEFLLNVGNLKKAKKYFDESLVILKKNFPERNIYLSEIYLSLGTVYSLQDDFESALQNYQLSLIANDNKFSTVTYTENPSLENIISPENYIDALHGKAQVFAAMYNKNHQKEYLKYSLNCYQLALIAFEHLKSKIGENSKLYLVNLANDKFNSVFDILYDLYHEEKNIQYIKEAFNYAEKGKASVLLSAIKGVDAIKFSTIPENLQSMEKDLREKLNAYESLIYDEKKRINPDSLKITFWEYKIFNLYRQHDSLIQKFEEDYPTYYASKYNTDVISVEELMQNLNADQIIIEYVLTDSMLYSFALSNVEILFSRQKIDTEFFHALDVLRNITYSDISSQGRVQYKEMVDASNLLYKILFKGFDEFTDGKRLIIVPDGVLGYLPFESLVTEIKSLSEINYRDLSYLLKKNPISYSYSSTLLFRDYYHKHNVQSLLAFAPEYDLSPINDYLFERGLSEKLKLHPLLYAKEEVSNISKIYKGEIYLDDKASETVFKKNASDFGIIHLAMHTIIDDVDPMHSKMIFANHNDTLNDGFLNTYEIYELDLQAQMAVLSACNTGSGKINKGEGIMSLARGFIFAGVPSIIMTLWEVEDKSGSKIMTLFYENLERGLSKDIAMQKAKLSYLDQSTQLFSHPYFWSAFVSIGKNDPLSNEVYSRYNLYFFIVFIVITSGLIWYRQKNRHKLKS